MAIVPGGRHRFPSARAISSCILAGIETKPPVAAATNASA
jgi:hypothetical protein